MVATFPAHGRKCRLIRRRDVFKGKATERHQRSTLGVLETSRNDLEPSISRGVPLSSSWKKVRECGGTTIVAARQDAAMFISGHSWSSSLRRILHSLCISSHATRSTNDVRTSGQSLRCPRPSTTSWTLPECHLSRGMSHNLSSDSVIAGGTGIPLPIGQGIIPPGGLP